MAPRSTCTATCAPAARSSTTSTSTAASTPRASRCSRSRSAAVRRSAAATCACAPILDAYAPGAGVAVHARADILDDLGFGSTPEVGTGRAPAPSGSPGQRPVTAIAIKRAWGEVLTPFGVLAAGRMGAHFGLGIVANGGDCEDCDGGDTADRIALVTPLAGHLIALAYDASASGPQTPRKDGHRVLDLEPSDDVNTVTAALLRAAVPATRARRAAAGRSTVEYGAYVSHRWQDRDVPASYLPTAQPVAIGPASLVARDFHATTLGGWLRLSGPRLRIEAEAAYLRARVGQASLIPGIELTQPITSSQLGVALETELAPTAGTRLGADAGYASGDPAPGFGAFPAPDAQAAPPGSFDGPQAAPPGDTTVDNFRFNPDYRIDQILFREIIGTITDAIYVRPHARATLVHVGDARIEVGAALIASWAADPSSTPSGARALGVELDPELRYASRALAAVVDYAVLFPGAAFDGASLPARAAQVVRVRLLFRY